MQKPILSPQNLAKVILANLGAITLMIALNSCGTATPEQVIPPDAGAPTLSSVSDATSGGNPYFYWSTNRGVASFPGVFDPLANPTVKICKVVSNVVTNTCPKTLSGSQLTITPDNLAAVPPVFGTYRFKWDTKNPALLVTDDYRVSVLIGTQLLGFEDVDLVATSNETKNPKAGFIAIVNGSTLDAQFRVEVGASNPNVSLSPNNLAFPTTFVGNVSAVKTATIKNVGPATLNLTGTTQNGANPNDFVVTLFGCGNVAPQATCTANITFNPTDLGPRASTVTLVSNGIPANLSQTISLTGGTAAQKINSPPAVGKFLISFPVRDFVHGDGYLPTDRVTVSILRKNASGKLVIMGMVHNATPVDDPSTPGFDGIVEINHPGGTCWENIVPDIKIGDYVRYETAPGVGDETRVQNMVVTQPATITVPASPGNSDGVAIVRGYSRDEAGAPMNIANFEQRMVAKKNQFDLNGKRTLRAGGAGARDGNLVFDAPGSSNWTATYTGLDQHDVDLIVAGESRVVWLGRNPLALTESSIYEYGQFPGFAGGCTGPVVGFAGPLATPTPGSLSFNQQALFPAPPSPVQIITMTNGGGASLSITNVVISGPDAGDFSIASNTCNGTVLVSAGGVCAVGVRFSPTAGSVRIASLDFIDSADNTPQSVPLGGNLNVVAPGPPNDPPLNPHNIFVFPSRDFIMALGYAANDRVKVEVLRGGVVIGVANNVVPVDDLSTTGVFDGIVQVNHPGGACWEATTPDLRPGDLVRLTTNNGVVDQTTAQNIIVTQPATQGRNADGTPNFTIIMKGVSLGQDGLQMPLGQFEARIVAKQNAFPVNGKRSLRAGGAGASDGVLTYDNPGNPSDGHWTAVFNSPGLTQADVDLAVATESRNVWLGRLPALLTESSLFEYGLSGGPVGCAAPLSTSVVSLLPLNLDFGNTPLGTTTATKTVTLTSTGPVSSNIASVLMDGIDPTEFAISANTCVGVVANTCTFNVSFTPGGLGARTASLQIVDSADGSPHSLLVAGQGVVAPPPNQAPVANDDFVSMQAGNTPLTIDVLANDTDPDNDTLTIVSSVNGANGNVICNPVPGGQCIFTPNNSSFVGTAFFAYTISDGNGHTDNGTVTVTILNNAPVAVNDSATTLSNAAVTVNVLTNDSDPENQAISITSSSNPTNGTANCTATTCTYTPNANFVGSDSFTYTISDGFGDNATATVSITVQNRAPNAVSDSGSSLANTPITIDVLANDTDPEGQALNITGSSNGSNGTVTCSSSGCTYTPNANFVGTDSFTYTISDGNGGSATGTVTVVISAPTIMANSDEATLSVAAGTTIEIAVTANDVGTGIVVTNTSNGPLHGTASFSGTSVTYVLTDLTFTGDEVFTYTITDIFGQTSEGTITIHVVP
jgi:Bacterial Ig domain